MMLAVSTYLNNSLTKNNWMWFQHKGTVELFRISVLPIVLWDLDIALSSGVTAFLELCNQTIRQECVDCVQNVQNASVPEDCIHKNILS